MRAGRRSFILSSGSPMRARFLFFVVLCIVLPTPARATDLTGSWSGEWRDTKSGHTGPLRATFSTRDGEHYRVTFTGRFRKVIPFRYTVELTVACREGERVFLTGEQKLPLFGTFTYTAEADAACFTARFSSRRYEGEFNLRRQCP